ncbi:hypothetical protein U27_01763 [Candidatus Vecturithrix granuli]|uniref:ResB-like domain-containing protein n=1 Tax=Vecturithrix granuli TaxID=1499967 RepID=A0A0S6W9D3_VECG1|nr:hypothetical protein U27_01763 [Candidatus Vecturithrix granuli]
MVLNKIFDLLSLTQTSVGRYVFIVLLSLLSAVIFLLIFKKTSNQKKIKYHKNKIFGYVLQIPLYKDRFGVLFSSIGQILKHNALYVLHTLASLIFIIIPLIFIMVQINNRCGYAPLAQGQDFLIQVTLNDTADQATLEGVSCELSPGIVLETPALRVEDEKQVFWRARVVDGSPENTSSIRIQLEGHSPVIEKYLATAYNQQRFSPEKKQPSFWNRIFYNAEGYLPADTPVTEISTEYARAGYPFLFWQVDAIILFFILTLIFGFALKGVFRVNL